jgi:hypothetical protein
VQLRSTALAARFLRVHFEAALRAAAGFAFQFQFSARSGSYHGSMLLERLAVSCGVDVLADKNNKLSAP